MSTTKNASRPLSALFVLVLAAAFTFFGKRWFSGCDVESLRWLLSPTTRLVEAVTGLAFDYERSLGFVHRALSFAITKPCAGVNFLLMSFALCALFLATSPMQPATRLCLFVLSPAVAYLATLIVNTCRISLTVFRLQSSTWAWLQSVSPELLTAERVHRWEGTAVYFLGLCAIHLCLVRSKRGLGWERAA